MVIARGTIGDKELLLLGLSRGNIERLTRGEPIRITRESHGDGVPEGWEVVITFGETELAMEQELRDGGLVSRETMVNIDPRLRG